MSGDKDFNYFLLLLSSMHTNTEFIRFFEEKVKLRVADSPKRVIAGISGGADSVALLLSLVAAGKEVTAVHCNFSLRGDESDRDQAFVTELTLRLGIKLLVRKFNTREYMLTHRLSMEMACRELRYSLFNRLIEEGVGDVVAVGHHRDDNVETMLINMLRGSGIEGMKGMTYSKGSIIRPLLEFSRNDILKYLESRNETFITDSSNLTTEPLRNFIRHEVIPLLQSREPGAVHAMERTRSMLERAERVYSNANIIWHKDILTADLLADAPDRSTAIHEFLKGKGANGHIENEMLTFFESGSNEGRVWNLKEGDVAAMRRDFYFIPKETGDLPEFSVKIIHCISSCDFQDKWKVYLPENPDAYEWVSAKDGMKMALPGVKGRKKVNDILSEAGIPAVARKRIKVLVRKSDNNPVWIPGVRRADIDKIDTSATEIFRIHIIEKPFYCNWLKKS